MYEKPQNLQIIWKPGRDMIKYLALFLDLSLPNSTDKYAKLATDSRLIYVGNKEHHCSEL